MNLLKSLLDDDHEGRIEVLKSTLQAHYIFRYNSVRNRIEFRKVSEQTFKDLTDSDVNSIMFEMIALKQEVSNSLIRTLLNSNFVQSYNPFKEYFDNLPAWDSTTDYISRLADRVHTTNDELWRFYLKKWLIGVVACAYVEDAINENVLIFKGDQNIGKTRFVRRIIPSALGERYYSEEGMNFRDQTSKLRLSECFIINLDEFENVVKSSPEQLKSMLSIKSRRFRRPYASLSEDFPRRASFAATINNGIFLKDTTGNRRYLVVDVLSIDHSSIDYVDQLYSQVFSLLKSGETYYFNAEEVKLVNAHNRQFELIQPEYEVLVRFLRPKVENDESPSVALTATEIMGYLATRTKLQVTTATIQKLGSALNALGYSWRKSNGNRLYDVVKL